MFLGVGVGLACFGAVLPMFLLYYLLFRSRNCLKKILLMSGLVFLGCLLSSFGCFADDVVVVCFFLFVFERDSSGSNRAHPHTHLFCWSLFLFFSRRFCLFALFGRASCFLGFSLGCHSGPQAFLGFSWYSSEALFLDARRQGCFFASCALCCFSPFRCVLRLFFTRTRRGGPVIVRGIPPGHRTRPAAE